MARFIIRVVIFVLNLINFNGKHMYSQETTLKNFSVIEKLGSGSFASVYKVQRLDDKMFYALKKVSIASNLGQNRINEIERKGKRAQRSSNSGFHQPPQYSQLQGSVFRQWSPGSLRSHGVRRCWRYSKENNQASRRKKPLHGEGDLEGFHSDGQGAQGSP